MRSSSVRFHLLPEPDLPEFVRRIRGSLDASAARHPSDVAVFHSYFGHESEDGMIAAQGWTSRIVGTRGPTRSPIDVYYSALDDDVMMTGGVPFGEWWPDDEAAASECLRDLERVVDDLAADRLPPERSSARTAAATIAVVSVAAMLIGFAIGRRRPQR